MFARGRLVAVLCCVALGLILAGCRSAPISGRKQLLLVPEDQEVVLGEQSYEELLETEPRSTNPQYQELVNRVGQRIAAVAGRPDFQWEFNVIASPQQNAFALPGGKVAVYEGILPVCQNEAGLAVVMSHEIAHVLARHGGERMSHDYVVNQVGIAVSHVMRTHDERRRQQFEQAYGLASRYGVILPYSRKHESEADEMGLLLMAKAGYDPREAPKFWQRFAAAQGSAEVPEFLSTHPSDQRRAEDLEQLLAEAVPLYEQAPQKFGIGLPIPIVAPPATLTGASGAAAQQPAYTSSLIPTFDDTRSRGSGMR